MVTKKQYKREMITWMIIVGVLAIALIITLFSAISYYGEMKYQKSKADFYEEQYHKELGFWSVSVNVSEQDLTNCSIYFNKSKDIQCKGVIGGEQPKGCY